MTTHDQTLRALLSDLRIRAGWLIAGDALAVALAGAVGLVSMAVIGLVVAPEWMWLRAAVLALVVVSTAVAALWALRRGWPAVSSLESLAAWVETHLPEYRTDIRTILGWKGEAESEVARQLREIAVHRTEARLRLDERPARILPRWRPTRLIAGALAPLLLVCVSLAVSFDATIAAAGALVSGRAALVEGQSALPQVPVIGNVELELTPPAYMGRGSERIPFSTGRVFAPAGTDVVWRGQPLLPARAGVLHIEMGDGEQEIPLTFENGTLVSPRWTLTRNGSYTVEVIADDGTRILDPIERTLLVEPDRPPTVELIFPTSDMEVVPTEVVNIEYLANDDYGLTQLMLVWYYEGAENDLRSMVLQDRELGVAFQEHVPFELGPLYLQAGDEVVVFVEAVDAALPEANHARSRAVRLRIDSPEDQHNLVLELKEALLEAAVQRLGAHLMLGMVEYALARDEQSIAAQAAPADAAARVASVQNAVGATASWMELLSAWDALVEAMASDELSTEQDRDLMESTGRALSGAHRAFDRLLQVADRFAGDGAVPDASWSQTALAAADLTRVLERAVLQLQDNIALHQADDVQRTLDELDQLRGDLRDLLERYRDARDPELREQIEQQFRRLEARMRELLERLAQQSEDLPYEHLNMDGLDPSELSEQVQDMTSGLDQLRQMLDSGDIDGALQALEQMEQALQQMEQGMDQAMDGAAPDGVSEFDQAMGELMDRLNDLEVAEQEILNETERIEQELREQRQEEIRDELQERLEQAMREVERARERTEQAPDDLLGEQTRQELRRAEEGLQRMIDLLGQEDLPGVVDQAARMGSQFSDMSWRLSREEQLRMNDQAGQRQAAAERRNAEQSERLMRRISESMEELMEMAQPTPDAQQQGQLDELAGRQGQVSEQLSELQRRAEEMGQRMPMIPEQFGQPMQQIGEGMQQSQQGLRQGQSGPAIRGQQSALDAMRSLRQQMQQMTRQQRQRQQQGNNGRANSQERVEIPEDQEASRQDYRQQVQEAMREGGIESFRDELRRYYETLVR